MVEPLVIPFVVVVRDELADGAPPRALADQDHALEAGVLDGAHEARRGGVQVRRAGGASDGGDIGRGERVAPGRPEERVAVMDEDPDWTVRGLYFGELWHGRAYTSAGRMAPISPCNSRQVVRFVRSGAGSRPRSLRTLARGPRAT